MYDTLVLALISLLAVWLIGRQLRSESDSWQLTLSNQRIASLWSIAQKSIRENDFVQAEKALLTILSFDENNAAAYNRIGIVYAKQKEYGDAIKCFMTAFNLEPNASSRHNLGLVYFNLEQYEKASVAFKQALEFDNQSALRHIEYAKVLERLGRHKEMLEALDKAAELNPNPEILKILLKTYRNRKLDDKAAEIEEKLRHLIRTSSQPDSLPRSSQTVA